MQKVKRTVKAGSISNPKSLKVEISQLIDKGLKKITKKVESLEKTVAKLKEVKAKTSKKAAPKKTKVPNKVKERGSKDRATALNQDLG
jgi:succinate dehydrogenase/fumarate reductase flavoprotein subunit